MLKRIFVFGVAALLIGAGIFTGGSKPVSADPCPHDRRDTTCRPIPVVTEPFYCQSGISVPAVGNYAAYTIGQYSYFGSFNSNFYNGYANVFGQYGVYNANYFNQPVMANAIVVAVCVAEQNCQFNDFRDNRFDNRGFVGLHFNPQGNGLTPDGRFVVQGVGTSSVTVTPTGIYSVCGLAHIDVFLGAAPVPIVQPTAVPVVVQQVLAPAVAAVPVARPVPSVIQPPRTGDAGLK